MNITIDDNDTIAILDLVTWTTPTSTYTPVETTTRLPIVPTQKRLNYLQIIELCSLCFILIEQTIIFLLTFRKRFPKENFVDNTNDSQQQRSIILPSNSLLYNCLHRNWIHAYSFSNICLSFVYFIIFILKYYNKPLIHYSTETFYALPLALVQQILINFTTFHLFIMSISILQYFIRYYRLLKTKYSLNIYNDKSLLITKHTNVALILSGSLALIFSYNYIFYTPNYSLSVILLPLITLNMFLLTLIDWIIFLFIIMSCAIKLYIYKTSLPNDLSFDDQPQQQQQQLANNVRSAIEKNTCIKCYSKVLKKNRTLFQDNDSYTKLQSRFFSQNQISSARPSLSCHDGKRKYSTVSYENIPMIHDQSRTRASYSYQSPPNLLLNISNHPQQDYSAEQQNERKNSSNELFIQTTLLRLKEERSLCHLCYCLLLLFLFKYVLLTFPQHFIQMKYYFKLFNKDILRASPTPNNKLSEPDETICRILFLIARFGDSLLLTRLSYLIKKYFPCWCHFNSKFFRKEKTFQRPSHQILMQNSDSPTNDPLSGENILSSNDLPTQQESIRKTHRRFRLHFQFVPIWSNKRERLFKQNR